MRFIQSPDVKVTLGTTVYTNDRHITIQVKRVECGFDTASIVLSDALSELYPSAVTANTAVQVDVKDKSESAYPTNPLFKGVVRFPVLDHAPETLLLKCDGAGYGFNDTVCGQEYGAQSRYTTSVDTLSEILTDANHGVVTKWVNKMMESATDSGFSYTTSIDANLTDTVNYLYFPYKPNNKCLDDLCDLLTAIRVRAGNKGPHWIVTTDDVLRIKELYSDNADWHKYYNAAAADADTKLYQGRDFLASHFEKILPEANYIIYYGAWRRPSNGDAWTENNAASWSATDCTIVDDTDAGDYRINSASILITSNSAVNPYQAYYPSTMDWGYDFTGFREYNIPHLNFWIKRSNNIEGSVFLVTTGVGSYEFEFYESASGRGPVQTAGKWYHLSIPLGEYAGAESADKWIDNGGDWSDIDCVGFVGSHANTEYIHVDGIHFGDAWVCRCAYNSTKIAADRLKTRVITDNTGKDDTLASGVLGTTDTGLMARMAYAELSRCQNTDLVGWVKTPMIKDLLPGQFFEIYAKPTAAGSYSINGTEMRVPKLIHDITHDECTSIIYLTDDKINSHPRPLYEDWNKILQAAARPEFQDRQGTSMKAGDIDIRVTRLAEDYG